MKILVVGAAGRTGSHLTRFASARGHHVTALVRHPAASAHGAGVADIVMGDATDAEVIAAAVQGQDAVISTVAAPDRTPRTNVSTITKNLVDAMQRTGPSRLIITSSRNLTATRPRMVVAVTKRVFRHVYADLTHAETHVHTSSLDWTVLRAVRLTDDPSRGRVHTDLAADATGGDWKLPRIDYAHALLNAAEDPDAIRKSIGVNGAARPITPAHDEARRKRNPLR